MLKVFNTMSRKKEEFKPLREKHVGMYVCGPTVYGPAHIGHARTYIAFDIIRRYLEYRGFKVNFVVNITDIHDDMIKKANEENTTIFELAEKNIKLFLKDMDELLVKRATHYPRVTENIDGIIKMIEKLEKNGYAYETNDGVYFDISKFKDYGKLSCIKVKKSKTGTRVNTDKYEKDKVQDFALWKKEKPNEPSWPSPWGNGRPGWHIECSVMSQKYLGEQIDVHGGAVDLIFPHHENEIAQSEGATGKKPFVKYWLHSGFLNVEGQKMAKSLGNFITVPELLRKYDSKVFRFFVAGLHYRSAINFSEDAMTKSKQTLEKLNLFIKNLLEFEGKKENTEVKKLVDNAREKFVKEMDDDFNLPNAWAELQTFVRKINKLISEKKFGEKNALEVVNFFKELNEIFQVFSFETEADLSAEEKKLIEEREKLRKEKKWAEADKIRAKLAKQGIILDDTPFGTKWRRK